MSKSSWDTIRETILSIIEQQAPSLPRETREDIAQDVLVKMCKDDERKGEWPLAFLRKVIRTTRVNYLRAETGRGTRKRTFISSATVADEFLDDRAEKELSQVLAKIDVERLWTNDSLLSDTERIILRLAYYYGLSSAEIAQVMDISTASTIRSLHKKLRDRLQYWSSES